MADQSLVRAVVLAAGVVIGGWAAGQGFVRARVGDRFVTVKGISEREVSADLAIWPLRLVVADNDLKPEMIAEATARAREAAEQFAADARSALGGIRRANQGVFEILPRDQARGIAEESQITKTVRVVSTVEFVLR